MVQSMRIYVGHSSSMAFRDCLYDPIRGSRLDEEHEVALPHENSDKLFDSKEYLREECDLFVAEVSEASTGLGIELGWADLFDVPIVCIHREGEDFSSALTEVADEIVSYSEIEEIPFLVSDYLESR